MADAKRYGGAFIAAGLAAALLAGAGAAKAQKNISQLYDFTPLSYPNSLEDTPLGINAKREVVGYYVDQVGIDHGYIWYKGKFASFDYPGAFGTAGGGISDRGDIAGTYFDAKGFQHGYIYVRPEFCEGETTGRCHGKFFPIDEPDAVQNSKVNFEFGPGLGTDAIGINRHRDVVGIFATPGLWSDAYLYAHGLYTPIDHPDASHKPGNGTKAFGISDNGVIAANYLTGHGAGQITHAFLLKRGLFIPIDVPGSEAGGFGAQVNGVNSQDEAAGVFTDSFGLYHGFLWVRGKVFQIDYPAQPYTEVNGISNRGDLVGDYAFSDKLLGYIALRK